MCPFQCSLLLCLSFFIIDGYALDCRIKKMPTKESELMRIYTSCVNKQERKGSADSQKSTREPWITTHRSIPKIHHDVQRNMEEYEWATKNRKHSVKVGVKDATTEHSDYDYVTDDGVEGSKEVGSERSYRKKEVAGHERGEIRLGEDYGDDLTQYDGYRSLVRRSNWKKLGEGTETNSGQRSQYNPNTRKHSESDESQLMQDSHGHDASRNTGDNACALHCFLESLKMTDETGFPNRFLVTEAIAKDIEDEELKEFLQEASEDCFEILGATKEEKCEFSKNLLMCLTDKGRSNCDDWKNENDTGVPISRGYSKMW